MDSSFLITIHALMGIFTCVLFLKMIIQFGWPNHPGRLTAYMVALCICFYFVGLVCTEFGLIPQKAWDHWRALPLVSGSLCLLMQSIMTGGNFSLIQQKVISRLPLMAALICSALFPQLASQLSLLFILAGGLFFIISVRKSRYQKRLYLKAIFFIILHTALNFSTGLVWQILSQAFLAGAVLYIFSFENSFGVWALIDDLSENSQGA
jgi:hypothetical protein